MRTITILLLFVVIFFDHSAYAQHIIEGKVIDRKTKKPLAFVNILFNNDPYVGTETDIDGKFFYESETEIKTLTCSYVGYENTTLCFDSIESSRYLLIELQEKAFRLQEVTLKAGENPANKIIRKVIANKEINNPENINSFKYTSYNKVIYDLKPADTPDIDSVQLKMQKWLKGGHIFIMESVTERKFVHPDKSEETVLGTKVSGIKNPSFAPIATDIQPFSFYKDLISIFDVDYLNPISKGSPKKYRFHIQDTLFQKKDTVFIIAFQPFPKKNFQGLLGLLYINTRKYAVQNVIAEPFEKGFIDVKIQQKYRLINNKQWFPEQLNFELIARKYPSKKMGMSANGKSYIRKVELWAELNKRNFSVETLKLDKNAAKRDSVFWNTHRTEALNTKEKITYKVIDSLSKKYNFEAGLHFFEKIALGKIPVKFIDIDLPKTLVYNRFEKLRLGLAASTNEKITESFFVGGFFGYGIRDRQWKYGGEFGVTLNEEHELQVRAKHQNTLRETGSTRGNIFNENHYDIRDYLAFQMDRIKQNSLSVRFRAFKYAQFNFSLSHTQVIPQYNYEYLTNGKNKTDYVYSNIRVDLRYAFNEKLVEFMGQRLSMGTKYPVIYLNYSKGIKNFYGGELDFNKIEAGIESSFLIKNLGKTTVRMNAGFIDRSLPYGLLFTGEGSFVNHFSILIKNHFQTATPYEFLSDRYVNLYFTHNFGALLFRTKKFSPHIIFHQNMGWGTLSNPDKHQMIEFKTKEKGLYESGLQIDNLLKINNLNIFYLGLGGGVFYRYGPYAYNNTADNFSFKISMSITTK